MKDRNGLYGWEIPFLIFASAYLTWHLMSAIGY